MEEARLLLDTADRARRHVDSEVADVREAMSTGEFWIAIIFWCIDLTNFFKSFFFIVNTANSIIATDKRRLDGDLRGMQQELDDLMNQMKNSEEKTKKALSDAG